MPIMPPTLGARSKAERDQAHDERRRKAQPWRNWYWTKAWKARRAEQLAREPLCWMHAKRGETVAATTADHDKPHRGDRILFFEGKLRSLCSSCHSSAKQAAERAGR